MSYYYYFPETEGMGHGKLVDEKELYADAVWGPSVFVQCGFCNISEQKGHHC
jgi:hypothetical protein